MESLTVPELLALGLDSPLFGPAVAILIVAMLLAVLEFILNDMMPLLMCLCVGGYKVSMFIKSIFKAVIKAAREEDPEYGYMSGKWELNGYNQSMKYMRGYEQKEATA